MQVETDPKPKASVSEIEKAKRERLAMVRSLTAGE
jgi:hypothetical protein